jgi:hypothetical protein
MQDRFFGKQCGASVSGKNWIVWKNIFASKLVLLYKVSKKDAIIIFFLLSEYCMEILPFPTVNLEYMFFNCH